MSKWLLKRCTVSNNELMDFYECSLPLAFALYHRGIRDKADYNKYLDIDNYPFEDILNLKDVKRGFEILTRGIKNGSNICIYGDYDVDGVMSTAILYKGLKYLGANVIYNVPHRVEDGYGLNINAVTELAKMGVDILITCDNGISAFEAISLAKENNIEVIILDHHEPVFDEDKKAILPDADAIIDAKIGDAGYRFKDMCAGGLCYRFIKGLFSYMNISFSLDNELCIFAGIATICDVVDLVSENRAIAAKALKLMNTNLTNTGLKKLIELKGITDISSYHIGFVIGPCINASGRLDSARVAVDLLLTDEYIAVTKYAELLVSLNDERKQMTEKGFNEIVDLIEETSLNNDKVIVAYSETIHESIAGIIAGRVKEKYFKPTIVLTRSKEGAKGSGRSIEKYNMFEELYKVSDLLNKFGGHAMAAGLSIDIDNIEELRKTLNDNIMLETDEMQPIIRIDGQLPLNYINIESIQELEKLSPFGKASEKPIFGIKGASVINIKLVGNNKNIVSFQLRDDTGISIKAIDFSNYDKWNDYCNELGFDISCIYDKVILVDAIFQLDINEYMGMKSPQIILKDIRFNKI